MNFLKATLLAQMIVLVAAGHVKAKGEAGCVPRDESIRQLNELRLEAAMAYPSGVQVMTTSGKWYYGPVKYHEPSKTYFIGGRAVPREAFVIFKANSALGQLPEVSQTTLKGALAHPYGVELVTVTGKHFIGDVKYHAPSKTYFVGGKPVPREAISIVNPLEAPHQVSLDSRIPPPIPEKALVVSLDSRIPPPIPKKGLVVSLDSRIPPPIPQKALVTSLDAAVPPPIPDHVLMRNANKARVAAAKAKNSVNDLVIGVDISFADYLMRLEKEVLDEVDAEKLDVDTAVYFINRDRANGLTRRPNEALKAKAVVVEKAQPPKPKNLDDALVELEVESGTPDSRPVLKKVVSVSRDELKNRFFNYDEHVVNYSKAMEIEKNLTLDPAKISRHHLGYVIDGFKVDMNGTTIEVPEMVYAELLSEQRMKKVAIEALVEAKNSGYFTKLRKRLAAKGLSKAEIDERIPIYRDKLLTKALASEVARLAQKSLGVEVGSSLGMGGGRLAFRHPTNPKSRILIYRNFDVIDGKVIYRSPEQVLTLMQRDTFVEKVTFAIEEQAVRAGREKPWHVAKKKMYRQGKINSGIWSVFEYEFGDGKSVDEVLISGALNNDPKFETRLNRALYERKKIDPFVMAVAGKRWNMAMGNKGPYVGVDSPKYKHLTLLQDGVHVTSDGYLEYRVGVDDNNATNIFDDGKKIIRIDQ